MASLIELVLELLRLEVDKVPSVGVSHDRVAADFGVGDRIGSIISKPLFLMIVAAFSWQFGVVFLVGVVGLCTLGVFILDRCIENNKVPRVPKHHTHTMRLKAAVEHIVRRYGWWSGVFFPLAVILNDGFVRPMIGVMLVDLKLPFWLISLGYVFVYVGGVVGATVVEGFFPKRSDLMRLFYSGLLNTTVNGIVGLCAVVPHLYVVCGLLFLSGLSQGLFLQFLRVCLGRMCVPRYAFLQMGVFLTVWCVGAPVASVSGLIVDGLGSWFMYFALTPFLYIPGACAIMKVNRIMCARQKDV